MSINSIIKSAVEPIVAACMPDRYDGEEREYCTFNYTELPACFGDDEAEAIRYLVQLHWFLPGGVNPLEKKRLIKRALVSAEFTCPIVTPVVEEVGQHYVFECEWAGGDV